MDFYHEAQKELDKRISETKEQTRGKIQQLRNSCSEFLRLEEDIKDLGLLLVKSKILPGNWGNPDEIQGKISALSQKKSEILTKEGILPVDEVFYCDICKDTGYVQVNGKKQRCSCFLNIYTDILTKEQTQWNTECDFDDFDVSFYPEEADKKRYGIEKSPRAHMQRVLDMCKDFTEKIPDNTLRNMIFTGKTGLGKTFLCYCMANELIRKGVSVLYIRAADLFNEITFNGNENLRKQIYSVPLLVIDDLGTERQTDMRYSDLLEILEKRQNLLKTKGYATVISTNVGTKELLSYYDERICSRLFGNYDIIRFVGEDIRLLKKQR